MNVRSTESQPQQTGFFGHPRGLATLFFTELWERFSYYGMRAILILYMTAAAGTGGLGMDIPTAGVVYGLYTAMVYLSALPGGWIADRLTGQRRAVLLGGILIAAGNFLLAAPGYAFFYGGLALVVAGTGLLKPNVSAIVGQLYGEKDRRRDAGFSIFYMGINIGAVAAPLACGWVAERIQWRYGFALAGIGMILGLAQYLQGSKYLADAGLHPATPNDGGARRQFAIGSFCTLLVLIAVAALGWQGVLGAREIANASGALLVGVVIVFFGWLFFSASWSPIERKRLMAIGVLFLAACVFWSVFEQAGSSLNLFALRDTEKDLGFFEIPASWFQSINGIFIVLLAPVFAALWMRLGNREPSSPAKFSLGLLFVGLGFVVMAGAATLAEGGIKVSAMWLLMTYLLHTVGELCLSPVGLSAMTKLAPARVAGLMMGVWFLSISVGNYIGGRVASLYNAWPLPSLFGTVAAVAIIAAIILALLTRPVVRLMGGVR